MMLDNMNVRSVYGVCGMMEGENEENNIRGLLGIDPSTYSPVMPHVAAQVMAETANCNLKRRAMKILKK